MSVTSCVHDHYTAALSVSIYIRSSSSTAAATHNIFVVVFVFVSVVTIDERRIGDSSLIIVTESKERRRAR